MTSFSVILLALLSLILSNTVISDPQFETLYTAIQKQQHDSNVLNTLYAPFPSQILNSSQLHDLLQNQSNFVNGVSLELVTKVYPAVEGKLKYGRSAIKLPNIDLKSINLTVFHRYGDVYEIGRKFPIFFSSQGPTSAILLKEDPTNHNQQVECGSGVVGEERVCVNSFKSMLKFVHSSLGTQMVKPVSAAAGKWQIYTIVGVSRIISNNLVGCHKLNVLPHAVYECHHINNSIVHAVPLAGEDGSKVEAVSVCHLDTTSWNSQHLAFQILDAKPGTPVCHFLATDDIAWLKM